MKKSERASLSPTSLPQNQSLISLDDISVMDSLILQLEEKRPSAREAALEKILVLTQKYYVVQEVNQSQIQELSSICIKSIKRKDGQGTEVKADQSQAKLQDLVNDLYHLRRSGGCKRSACCPSQGHKCTGQ
jgi:hypothetical protein